MPRSREPDPAPLAVARLALGAAGLGMAVTLVSLAIRTLLDIGGRCATFAVAAASCPDGAVPALGIGVVGLLAFGGLALWGGASIGGRWRLSPALAWVGLFGSLGWGCLDAGLLHPAPGTGVTWAWTLAGVLLGLVAIGPIALALRSWRGTRRAMGPAAPLVRALPGAGNPTRRSTFTPASTVRPSGNPRPATTSPGGATPGAAPLPRPGATPGAAPQPRPGAAPLPRPGATPGAAPQPRPGAAPLPRPGVPLPRPGAGGAGVPGATGGTISPGARIALDRLERLARLRDRGLLTPEEFETAKLAAMRELGDDR